MSLVRNIVDIKKQPCRQIGVVLIGGCPLAIDVESGQPIHQQGLTIHAGEDTFVTATITVPVFQIDADKLDWIDE